MAGNITKDLLVAMVILIGALLVSSAHAADLTSGKGKFIPLTPASTKGSIYKADKARFMSLGDTARPSAAIALNRNETDIGKLTDPAMRNRVANFAKNGQPLPLRAGSLSHFKPVQKMEAAPFNSFDVSTVTPEPVERELLDLNDVPKPLSKPEKTVKAGEEVSFIWPVKGSQQEVSSGFGPRKHPVTGKRDFHAGIDIPAPKGTAVLASADGMVSGSGTHPRLGRYVKISHADGTYALYGHLHSWATREGRAVKAGDKIGTVGATGRATGPHLDFSIRRDGAPIDPLPLLQASRENKTLAMLQ